MFLISNNCLKFITSVRDQREKFLFYYTSRLVFGSNSYFRGCIIWHLHNGITAFGSDICQLKLSFKGTFNKGGLFLIETNYYLGKTCLNNGAHNNNA